MTTDSLRRGDRTVIRTPSGGLRFGNWLYLWLDAHQRSAAGHPTRVLEVPGMASWFTVFPGLRPLTVAPRELRFHDRREWNDQDWHQVFGKDFSRATLQAFIRDSLLPAVEPAPRDRLVLNVRRGDYYSNAALRERYGFDQVAYLTAALERFDPPGDVLVVSDDAQWCRQNVAALLPAGATVQYAEPDPAANFLAVAGARRIIGMNSTFTYWAAYIADALWDDAEIVMPLFHGRLPGHTDAHQLDPRWTALEGFH